MTHEELRKKVVEVIDEFRPKLKADGGDIDFHDVTPDGVVKVSLKGACAGCAMSHITLKNGVEFQLKKAIPEIRKVINI